MASQPTIVRISANAAPRDTIVAWLGRSRKGRGQASKLTQECGGYYFAIIDHPDTASVFQAALTQLGVLHSEITQDELPGAVRVNPKGETRTEEPDGLGLGAAADAFLASLSAQTSSIFGGRPSGRVRIFF